MRLLLAEDDAALAEGLLLHLRAAGYAVDWAADGAEADYLGREGLFDAVILDLGLPGPLRVGDWELDEARQMLLHAGNVIALTAMEFRLLRLFMLQPGQVLAKSWLEEHVYDEGHEHGSNVLEVYVNRLRAKLGRERIETRRGQGYVFVNEPSA